MWDLIAWAKFLHAFTGPAGSEGLFVSSSVTTGNRHQWQEPHFGGPRYIAAIPGRVLPVAWSVHVRLSACLSAGRSVCQVGKARSLPYGTQAEVVRRSRMAAKDAEITAGAPARAAAACEVQSENPVRRYCWKPWVVQRPRRLWPDCCWQWGWDFDCGFRLFGALFFLVFAAVAAIVITGAVRHWDYGGGTSDSTAFSGGASAGRGGGGSSSRGWDIAHLKVFR